MLKSTFKSADAKLQASLALFKAAKVDAEGTKAEIIDLKSRVLAMADQNNSEFEKYQRI